MKTETVILWLAAGIGLAMALLWYGGCGRDAALQEVDTSPPVDAPGTITINETLTVNENVTVDMRRYPGVVTVIDANGRTNAFCPAERATE